MRSLPQLSLTLFFSSLLAVTVTMSSAFAQESSLDEIIEAHVKALGGKEAIAKIVNFQRNATVTLKSGFGPMSGKSKELIDMKAKRYHSDLDLGQYKKTETLVGDSGSFKGTDGEGQMDAQAIAFAQMSLGVSPLLSANETVKELLTVKGTSNFNDKDCHVVAINSDIEYLVNTKTHLLEGMKLASIGTLTLGNYKAIKGIQFPGTRNLNIDAQGLSIKHEFTATKINIEIDDSIFGDVKESEAAKEPKAAYSAEQIIDFLDKDDDEKISKAEAAASPELAPAFAYVDTNEDGFIDLNEAKAMVEYTKNENAGKSKPVATPDNKKTTAKSIIASMDKNNDGKISKSEANAELQPFFADVDANSDGFIDEKEGKVVAEFVNQNR